MYATETIPSNTCTIEYTGTNYPPDKGDGILDWNAAVAKAVMPIGLIKMVSSKCSRAHDELQAQSVLNRPSFVSTRLELPTKKRCKETFNASHGVPSDNKRPTLTQPSTR